MIRSFRHTLSQSFALKVLCASIAVIILVLTTLTVFAVLREGKKEKSSLEEQGEMLARILARNSIVGVYSENKQILGNMTESIISLKNVVAVIIYNADFKKILYVKRINPSSTEDVPLPTNVVAALHTGHSLIVRESAKDFEFITPVMLQSTTKNDETLYFGDSSKVNAGKVIGYVYITLSKDAYHKQIAAIILENSVIMLIFVVSSAVIVFFLVRKVTQPLKMLTDNVKALEKGSRVEHVPVGSKDEVGNLASAFNSMVEARGQAEQLLRHSEERYRQLVELSPDGI
ncbi:MAG TPA: HAMP domain-containing protein, partial [Nitrospirota bacterium]|nr:HAMP domain-containing protein [Nitrospirota bacterium]